MPTNHGTAHNYNSRTASKFVIRFDNDVSREEVARIAKQNKRSMNSELLIAIDNHLQSFEAVKHDSLAAKVSHIRDPRDVAILTALVDAMLSETTR